MNDIFHLTMGELLTSVASHYPEQDALVYPDRGLRYSWRAFDQKTDLIARGLLKMGIGKGDHVALWASNVPEWVILQFATAKIGAVLVTINTSYQAAELEYILRQSDAGTLFMVGEFKGTDYLEIIRRVLPELNAIQGHRLSGDHPACASRTQCWAGHINHPASFETRGLPGRKLSRGSDPLRALA